MNLDLPICETCGVQYAAPRDDCPVCLDERQYVGWPGQRWTALAEMEQNGYRGELRQQGPGVIGIGTMPSFAIGQRALLIRAGGGNVLWDCVSYLDEALLGQLYELGGISAVAVSHPHFYGSMIDWAHAFDAPVYIHAADRKWVTATRPDDSVVFWEGETHSIGDGLTLINAGVHFAGGQVLHWRDADSDGAGALFSGDILQVVKDRRWVSFMYSYPNFIPERPRTIRRALALLAPFAFERVYGAWWDLVVSGDGAEAVRRSADRYLRFALDDSGPP